MRALITKFVILLASSTLVSSVAFAMVDIDNVFPDLEAINADYLCQDEDGGGLAFSVDSPKAWVILSEDASAGLALIDTMVTAKSCEDCYTVSGYLPQGDSTHPISTVTLEMSSAPGAKTMPATYTLESSDDNFTVPLNCTKVTTATAKPEPPVEPWSSDLLLDTCPDELQEAVDFVLKEIEFKGKYIAILPEEINYQYFKMEFRTLSKSIAVPSKSFEFEFEYWIESDDGQDMTCTRVEPLDYIY